MPVVVTAIRKFSVRFPQAWTGLLIFMVSLLVYLLNGQVGLISNDNVPHTLLAFNWLENHTLNLDILRNSHFYRFDEPPYFFIEAPNGHLTSTYPIGTSIVTFPLYVGFYCYLKAAEFVQSVITGAPVHLLNIADRSFESYRFGFGKLAAAISTAFSVTLFYYCLRLKFQPAIALITTFLFAFATSTWVLSAQDIRQHTISNLLLVSIIFCLFKANRTEGKSRRTALLVAGIFCGLLPGVRLTSLIFSLAAGVYTLYTFRKEIVYFGLGLCSIGLNLSWNIYYFGWENFSGGYTQQFRSGASSYRLTIQYFFEAASGLLISPNDGLFVYSPVLLFAFPGGWRLWQQRTGKDEQLLVCLTAASIILILHYCIYQPWDGGSDSYSSRFTLDILPVICLLIAYSLQSILDRLPQSRTAPVLLAIFLASLLFSTGFQVIGAFSRTDWGSIPVPVLVDKSRLWDFSDTQIARHFNNLSSRLINPISDPDRYVQGLAAEMSQLVEVKKGEEKPVVRAFKVRSGGRRVYRVVLRNTGRSQWFGYRTALDRGETRIRVRFFDTNNELMKRVGSNFLYLSSNAQPGEATEAIGRIVFPRKQGQYSMVFDLVATRLEEPEQQEKPILYHHTVEIGPAQPRP
jgi:hypothetical protein